jgi:hypothetical protein
VPKLLLKGMSFYDGENIEISAKTTMRECYCERCRLLIYQESPDISGIFLVSLDPQFLHPRLKRLWIDA